jgi:hypothetical protein
MSKINEWLALLIYLKLHFQHGLISHVISHFDLLGDLKGAEIALTSNV